MALGLKGFKEEVTLEYWESREMRSVLSQDSTAGNRKRRWEGDIEELPASILDKTEGQHSHTWTLIFQRLHNSSTKT